MASSPKILLKKLGIRKAIKKTSVKVLEKKLAKQISLNKPKIRLIKTAKES